MRNITDMFLPIPSKRRSGLPIEEIRYIVCHDTGNFGSTAHGNVRYYIQSANEMQASAHVFVDDKETIWCIPETERAWHVRYNAGIPPNVAGNYANDHAIGVELCYGGLIDSVKAYEAYCELLAHLCDKYALDPRTSLIAHSTLDPQRRSDPQNAFTLIGKSWDNFISDVVELLTPKQTTMEKIEVLSKDGAMKVEMDKPNFDTIPNSRYCMITKVSYYEPTDETTITYTRFDTDENNVIHLDDEAYMITGGKLSDGEALEYAKKNSDEDIIVNLNF